MSRRGGVASRPLTEAEQAAVVAHLPMAEAMAKRRRNPCVRVEDRIQCAYIGLMDAVKGFDPAIGVPFEKYAARRIWGAIRDGEREGGLLGNVRNLRRACRDSGREIPRVKCVGSWVRSNESHVEGRDMIRSDSLFVASEGPNAVDDRDEVETALRCLPERDRTIVRRRFVDDATQKAAGEAVGVSESRVSQLVPQLLDRLRDHRALSRYAKGA